jgi:hypothetical protein
VTAALDNKPALARQAAVKIAEQSVDPAFRVAPRNSAFAHWDRSQLVDAYWQHHPRFVFLKSAPYAAKLLGVGAGDGACRSGALTSVQIEAISRCTASI